MEIEVTFPGGKQVDARVGKWTIHTDQPASLGGEDTAPGPFDLFLASIASCAGIYVLGFCQARKIPTDGLRVVQHVELDADSHLPTAIRLEVRLPAGMPSMYCSAVKRAVEGCKVKRTIQSQPLFEVDVVAEGALDFDENGA